MAKTKKKQLNNSVVVAGDVTIDWLEIIAPVKAANHSYNWRYSNLVNRVALPGGALLLANFIRAATGNNVPAPEVDHPEDISPDKVMHSVISLNKFPYSLSPSEKNKTCYRVQKYHGFMGPAGVQPSLLKIKNDDPTAEIVVIDDANNGFREAKAYWPAALKKGNKPVVIVRMSRPIAEGALWDEIQKNHAERAVLVIDADDLRKAGINISSRLSWERTAKDFVWQMASNLKLFALNKCAYLVVGFGVDGAIIYQRRGGAVKSRLLYDPKVEEDGYCELFPGKMPGVSSVFVAAITAEVSRNGLDGVGKGVGRGIQSARCLCRLGFGRDISQLSYPYNDIFKPPANDEHPIYEIIIPNPSSTTAADPDYWCIINDLTKYGLDEVALNYVIHGSDPKLSRIPLGQFRNLRTYDRSEIESYRSVRNLIREYLSLKKVDQPLSIAVFGKPGSGKSFGVAEVANSIAPGEIEKVEFNLSQFKALDDLIAAFHRVRDINLSGKVPLVFFDEFDCDFDGRLGWLKYFLAPMQDGQFRVGEIVHPIGRAIFVFAGGTCSSFAKFCRQEKAEIKLDKSETTAFKDAKGPDFVSRLRGFVNIKGPNPINEADRLYIIRRALFLRFLLQKKTAYIFDNRGKCAIDAGILRAMIKIPEYKHGVRSMAAIIEMSLLSGRRSFEQAALPLPEQLEMHVDAELFNRLVMSDVILGSAREKLAKAIHEKYLQDQKASKVAAKPSLVPWERLREDFKESNRRQADHIPVKLNAIKCGFTPVINRKPAKIKFTKKEIETMAKLEHERWNTEKFINDWSYGKPRNDKKKIHPYLVKWAELPEDVKEWDRQAVRAIPELMAMAGFEIFRYK